MSWFYRVGDRVVMHDGAYRVTSHELKWDRADGLPYPVVTYERWRWWMWWDHLVNARTIWRRP